MSVFNQLDPRFLRKFEDLYQYAKQNGFRPVVTSARRSLFSQARLYREYQRGQTNYGVSPPGYSAHNHGRAIDIVSDNNVALGKWWISVGGKWGGPNDPVHFEL